MSGPDKRTSQPPKGAEHQPPAIQAAKRRRLNAFMEQFSPRRVGSTKYQRLREQRGR